MPKLFDLVYPMGTYKDPNTGQEKTRWKNCGVIIRTAAGKVAMKLDALPINPLPNQDGQPGIWLQCMEPRPPQGQNTGQPAPAGGAFGNPTPAAPAPAPFKDDDIPFK